MGRTIAAKTDRCRRIIAAWLLALALLPLMALAGEAASQPDDLARLEALNKVVGDCLQAGRYKSGLVMANYAVELAEHLRGPNDPAVATALIGVGRVLGKLGNHSAEALGALNRALEIDAAAASESPAVARDLLYLARQLGEARRFDSAATTYARLIALDERLFGPDHYSVARDLDSLALLLRDFGDAESAEALQRRAVSILDRLFRDNPGEWGLPLASALNNLADGLSDDQRLAESEELFRRSLALNERALGSDNPGVAVSLNNLAEVLRKMGKYADAEPLYARAIAIDQSTLGASHPKVATLMNNFAKLLRDTNRRADAEKMFRQALASDEEVLGPEHPVVARDLKNLAQFMLMSQRSAEGVPLMRRVVAILQRQEADSGAPVFEIGQAMGFLGEIVVASGDAHAGEDLYRQGLALDEKNFGEASPVVEKDLRRYAEFLQRSNRATEANELVRRADAIAGSIARNRQVSMQHARCLLSDCDRNL